MKTRSALHRLSLSLGLVASGLLAPGCATITGTVASPITGGVDLVCESLPRQDQWYLAPPVFLAGALAGPFVAFYNGVNYDASIFRSWREYWQDYHDIFKPFALIRKGDN